MERFDVVVVGAGIAGASAAWALARSHRVCLLEREDQPGRHATARSATMFATTYGDGITRRLAAASRSFLDRPPEGFADGPLLSPRGMLHVASPGQEGALEEFAGLTDAAASALQPLDRSETCRRVPILLREMVLGGMLDRAAASIDDHRLFRAYLRGLQAADGSLRCGIDLQAIEITGSGFRLRTGQGTIEASFLVNAAGAWADQVAGLAGLQPLGFQALRRTAVTIDPPDGRDPASWPMAIDIAEQWYFKPQASRLLLSPADETSVEPQDVQPEEWDVAVAVDRYTNVTGHQPRQVRHRWAGLRTFASDRAPVVGRDPRNERFLWLAGQGGAGFMTAPAMAAAACALVDDAGIPEEWGLTLAELSPARLG